MFHDRNSVRASASNLSDPGLNPALEAAQALCDLGVEQANLSKKLCDNTRAMLLSAAADKDAGEVGRTLSVFVDCVARDLSENAETMSRIWRRYLREAGRAAAFAAP
jgi:hypothetical protein